MRYSTMTKKRKSKSGGGKGGGGGGGGGGGVGGSNNYKRPRFTENDGGSSGNNSSSHSRFSNDLERHRGYYDPNTGQFGVFPGLEENDDEFYGPANDGIDYLKMVRSEAKSVPTLLVAGQQYQVVKPRSRPPPVELVSDTLDYGEDIDTLNYDDESVPTLVEPEPAPKPSEASEHEYEVDCTSEAFTPDAAGWYHDGTYTAVPPPPTPTIPLTALSLWHAALLTTFRMLRTSFHTAPYPPGLHTNLPPIPPTLPLWRQQQLWNTYILHSAPTPRTLRAMSQERVIHALEALTQTPRVKKGLQGWWAEWIWGLLVRCEVCLTAGEVSVVRGVGKRALVLRRKLVCEGGWKGKKREEEEPESEWDGEEPEGWIEPEEEEKEEKEGGELEEGECDETELERAKRKAINALTQVAAREESSAQVEPEVNVASEGNMHSNPDAIDLDFDELSTASEEVSNPGPETLKPDVENESGIITPEVGPALKHEATEPVQIELDATQNASEAPLDMRTNLDTTNIKVQTSSKAASTALETDANANSKEINIKSTPSLPSSVPALATPYVPQKKNEHTLADTLGALDMVISVVGDFFGQRDLLDEREGQPVLTMA